MEATLRGVDAVVVVDLGFGDAGKGLLVDALTRRLGARLVVRWHGGAQAGHNVVTADGRHHTFSQLGAGSFVPGVATWLGPDFVFDPLALAVEARRLPGALGRVTVHGEARVVTPMHVAANRLRERARGEARHGSCGAGVGEVVVDARAGEAIRVAELGAPDTPERLRALQARKLREIEGDGPERAWLQDGALPARWLAAAVEVVGAVRVGDDADLARAVADGPVIFEGAQGVGLDEVWGFHPYSTWSDCTPRGALRWRPDATVLGVLRTHAHRHGPGPLPTESAALSFPEPHNGPGPWQGAFRAGWPDRVLARYTLDVCRAAGAPVKGLVLTHLDRVRPGWRVADAWQLGGERVARLPLSPPDAEGRLAARLSEALPELRDVAPERFVADTAAALDVPVVATAWGPRAEDLR